MLSPLLKLSEKHSLQNEYLELQIWRIFYAGLPIRNYTVNNTSLHEATTTWNKGIACSSVATSTESYDQKK